MRGVTAVAFGAILLVVFLGLVAAMAWQEAAKRTGAEPPEYILNDAVVWIRPRLTPGCFKRLSSQDVLHILEWQVYFLQSSVRGIRRGEAEVVVGNTEPAVAYICSQAEHTQGRTYQPEDVAAVLDEQGAYLMSIGAVGNPVEGGRRQNRLRSE